MRFNQIKAAFREAEKNVPLAPDRHLTADQPLPVIEETRKPRATAGPVRRIEVPREWEPLPPKIGPVEKVAGGDILWKPINKQAAMLLAKPADHLCKPPEDRPAPPAPQPVPAEKINHSARKQPKTVMPEKPKPEPAVTNLAKALMFTKSLQQKAQSNTVADVVNGLLTPEEAEAKLTAYEECIKTLEEEREKEIYWMRHGKGPMPCKLEYDEHGRMTQAHTGGVGEGWRLDGPEINHHIERPGRER